jgi:anti-sigma factor RsiW
MNRPEDIQEQLSAYVDGQLSGEEARRVEQAIQADESLARDVAAIRATRDVLRAEKTLSPSPDFVDRVLAEARRRNLIAAPQPAVQAQAAGLAAPQTAAPPAPRRWLASWPVRLAMAASLVLAVAAGGTVAVLYWTNYPPAALPTAATDGTTRGAARLPLADAEGRGHSLTERITPGEGFRQQIDGGWVRAQKRAADPSPTAKPMPEELAADKLRPSPVEAKADSQNKDGKKEDYYYANAKAIVRDLAGEARAAGSLGRRGGNAKNAPINDVAANEEEASGEAVQKLDLHVTHLAAARREVAAILTAAAAPAATGGPAKAKGPAGEMTAAPATATPAETPERGMRPGPAKPAAGGVALPPTAAPAVTPGVVAVAPPRPSAPMPAPRPLPVAAARPATTAEAVTMGGNGTGAGFGTGNGTAIGAGTAAGAGAAGKSGGMAAGPAAAGASPAGKVIATLTDGKGSPVARDRADLADKFQPNTSPALRASALASLRGMACDGSAGAGVWKFVIVDTPERIERISQAVRRVGVLDRDAVSDQRLCVAEPAPSSQAYVAGRNSQSQSAPYHVAEIQRRPEPRTAEPLRLLIITLRAEPTPATSNANPDRNLGR